MNSEITCSLNPNIPCQIEAFGQQQQFALGPYIIDLRMSRLLRDGVTVRLRPQAFRALRVLLENPGLPIDCERMIEEAWDGLRVSKHTVIVTMQEVKAALDECGSWIKVRPRLGYSLELPSSENLIRVGQHYRSLLSEAGFENALQNFKKAAEIDLLDARAAEAIANTYLIQGHMKAHHPHQAFSLFLGAFERAVALRGLTTNLRLDRAWAAHIFELKIAEVETELLEIVKLGPETAELHVRLAGVHSARGHFGLALEAIEKARLLDSLHPAVGMVLTGILKLKREFPQAVEAGRQAIDLHPGSVMSRAEYADALESFGRIEEALREYRTANSLTSSLPWIRAAEGRCLAKLGKAEEAKEILYELNSKRTEVYVDAYQMALLLESLGEDDAALDELERACVDRSCSVLNLKNDSKVDRLRFTRRFLLLEKTIFPEKLNVPNELCREDSINLKGSVSTF